MAKPQQFSPLTNESGTSIGTAPPGASGPGFYQGMVGRKTGRPSPRTPVRAPRHEQILAAHSLIDSGAADPNQGQLFPTSRPPSMREQASASGVAPPLASSRPGFMPGVYEHPKGGFRDTGDAHKAMVAGVKRVATHELGAGGDYVSRSGEDIRTTSTHLRAPGTEGPETRAPMAHAMHERQTTADRIQGDAPWYASRTMNQTGRYDLGPGSATEMVRGMAHRTGESYEMAARVTAVTSPRTRWTGGQAGTDDFEAPNVESAENVVKGVQGAYASGKEFRVADVGAAAHGRALGEMKSKAAVLYNKGETDTAIPIGDLSSQKVPNFEQSLLLGHGTQSTQRQAAAAYTVDTHDVTSQGSHVDLLKTQPGYAVSHMLGRRTALANRDLAPMSQSRVWEGQRSKTPEPLGEHSLFEETRSGKVRPRHNALPGTRINPSQFEAF